MPHQVQSDLFHSEGNFCPYKLPWGSLAPSPLLFHNFELFFFEDVTDPNMSTLFKRFMRPRYPRSSGSLTSSLFYCFYPGTLFQTYLDIVPGYSSYQFFPPKQLSLLPHPPPILALSMLVDTSVVFLPFLAPLLPISCFSILQMG